MKKIYYIAIIIITTFISIYNVKALTQIDSYVEAGIKVAPKSCSSNLLKYEYTNIQYKNQRWYILDETEIQANTSRQNANNYFIEINPNTAYYFYRYTSGSSVNVTFNYFAEDLTYISYKTLYDDGSFTTPSNAKYILFTVSTFPSNALSWTNHFMISETEGLTEFISYEECTIGTEPEEPVTNSTLDDFYNIFNSKLKLLASYTLENKYLFSVIGIVVLFAVLGIFFKIFRIGGGR